MHKYLVGGAVRDFILKSKIRDKDWVVLGSNKKKMFEKGFLQVGKFFPVFIHPISKEEYALARTDTKIGKKHTDFKTNYNLNITLIKDLKRRDITINAIAMDKYGNFIDPCKGLEDLKNKIIQNISSSFEEDPLRIFRVASFAARLKHLNFYVTDKTIFFMKKMIKRGDLKYISIERIWKETEKALKSQNPHIYFYILYKCKALKKIFVEFYNSIKKKIKKNKNNEKKIINIFKININKISDISIIFALFCLKFNIKNIKLIKSLGRRIKIPLKIINFAILVFLYQKYIDNIKYKSSKYVINLLNKIDCWKRPYVIKKISLVKYLHTNNKNKRKLSDSFFFYKYFYLVKNIDIKNIVKKNYDSLSIRISLNNQRILYLNKYRNY
ncbi:Multifunctional CCA protein [Candidatus Annandia adelgestsuga]|uniref:Multifunctional CCA protein n=1 Tax=Candidatus Annandia adelgestsuga TaxID=1302411 RepID=A0A3S9J7P9_9ENTR|nr:tRNA CCA-pyrophosphorylase [Candidatus Annandia adelgestsuga]AZP36262.1 Multifunctional CCA protein [Candidatus Annandia adelgestsuga]